MKLPIKYKYSYFILPFIIKDKNINTYINNIKSNRIFKEIRFTKKTHPNFYITFSKNLCNSLFNKNLRVFEYININNLIGSINASKDDNTIYFDIFNIKLFIFNTGISFLVLKTIPNTDFLEDVLDFNYRFKEIVSDLKNLEKFQTIKISDGNHDSLGDFQNFIENIIDCKLDALNNYTNMESFYTFSYLCTENSVWNENTDKGFLSNIIQKFMKVYSSSYNADISQIGANIETEYEYRKIGLTKISSNLLCSGVDSYNFGYLPFEYETIYLFTYILALFYRISLNDFERRIFDDSLDNKFVFKKLVRDINNFNKNYWSVDITNSQRLTKYFNGLIETLNLNRIYLSIISKINLKFKELKINENISLYKNIIIILFTTLILYIFFKLGGF